jgi:enamine deaminase RidA (YjgF/YER057c/UK114 family)
LARCGLERTVRRDVTNLHRASAPSDFKAQAREVFKALKSLVESAGGTMDNIVKLNTYLMDIRYRAELAPIRESPPPNLIRGLPRT